MASRIITLVETVMAGLVSHIDLATEDGNELLTFGAFTVQFVHVVMKLLDAEHVAMVSNCHATHSIGYGFINQRLDGCLAIKNRVLGVYVKMYKWYHIFLVNFIVR